MLDESVVGRRVSLSSPHQVTAESIRRFREATLQGGSERLAPPTYPIMMITPLLTQLLDELGVPLRHVVHANQSFAHSRPVLVGDLLDAALTVRSVRSVGDDDLLSLRADVHDHERVQVCSASTTLLHRTAAW